MEIFQAIKLAFKRYFALGLIVFLPLIITVKIFFLIIDFFDSILAVHQGRFLFVFPESLHPDHLLGFSIPGLGVVFSVVCILCLGALSRNYLGKKILRWGGLFMDHIPLARNIYKVLRDMVKTYAKHGEKQFNKVVLIQFPHANSYALGFLTGEGLNAAERHTSKRMLNVFVPTTPNPTSGFLMFYPADQVIELQMSLEDAFKLIVSGGMVNPEKLIEDSLHGDDAF